MLPYFAMLSMQAAGMVIDFMGTSEQADLMNEAAKLQQLAIETNIKQVQLETENSSLAGMKELRQTLGSQIAVMAARGTSTGAGSAVSLLNQSQENFNADEKVRRLNSLGKQNQLRSQAAISRLQNSSDISKLWTGFASRTFNKLPSSPDAWEKGIDYFKQGFGLTSMGS